MQLRQKKKWRVNPMANKMNRLDNTNTIVNLSNSILKHFGVTPFHNTIPTIDKILEGHPKVAVMLFDGLGTYVIEKHLAENSFMRSHFVHKINATYPPTTVASTTGFLTAKFPKESGWMGWFQYHPDLKTNVQSFTNKRESDGVVLAPKQDNLLFKFCPYQTIFELIGSRGVPVFDVKCFPVYENGPTSLDQANEMIDQKLDSADSCFLYFYWNRPDEEIHEFGVESEQVHECIKEINAFVEKVTKEHPDTLFLTIADHALIDVEFFDICDHKDLYSLLTRPLSIEARTISMCVDEKNKNKFEELFNRYYGQYFLLLTRQETLDYDLFGVGEKNPYYDVFVGDYVALSISNYCLFASKEYADGQHHNFIGAHAGFKKEETEINISAYNIKKEE